MIEPIIRTERLTRYFDARSVIRDLDLAIPPGQVTALLGLNGAGKTTIIRIIMGLLRPTRGKVTVFGENTAVMTPETRARIGYMIEGHFLYSSMSIEQCASLQCAGYPHWDHRLYWQIVNHFGIRRKSRVGELSRGQRAGVSLALVLAPDPELLVLDDPALGLDPVSRRALNETLIEFSGDGKRTVLLSTHLLDDVERVADRVMLLAGGRLKVDTTIDDFMSRVSGYALQVGVVDPSQVAIIPGLIEARRIGDRLQLTVADADQETRGAIDRIGATSVESVQLTFADSVLSYLTRDRGGSSFLNANREGVQR